MKKYKKYIITLVIGAIFTAAIAVSRGFFHETTAVTRVLIASDAFFITGVLLGASGLLVLIAETGNFHVFTYSAQLIRTIFHKSDKEKKPAKNLFEYEQSQQGKHRNRYPLLVIGGIYLVIGILFTFLYYQ